MSCEANDTKDEIRPEIGEVVEIDEDMAIVRYERQKACEGCKGCMAGIKQNEMLMRALNIAKAEKGDFVEVALPENQFLKAVVLLYGIPFVFMIFGFFVGYKLPFATLSSYRELYAFIVGVIFMAITYFIIAYRDKKKATAPPKIVKIVNK